MKKIILLALMVGSVSVPTMVMAQNQKNSTQPVKSVTATSNTPATKNEVVKNEVKADKKEMKKEAPKAKKESKAASTPAK